MRVFIGSEHIITPLGNNVEQNIFALNKGLSSVKSFEKAGYSDKTLFLSKFESRVSFETLIHKCFSELELDKNIIESKRTKVVISSTKGSIDDDLLGSLSSILSSFKDKYKLANTPLLVSNACISGVLAINKGAEMIRADLYDTCIIIGCDVMSDFVVYGFEALYALADGGCKPYDKDRTGINIGEGAAAVVLSNNDSVYKEEPLEFVSGSSSNDANHISGPSRTGEGLYRSINKTLKRGNVEISDIDYISAHGTATAYNDNMESIALSRLGMTGIPLNSYKAYLGHTLGAAGLIETIFSMQSIRTNTLFQSKGYTNCGTDHKLNIISETKKEKVSMFLKTASGFGGANASLIVKKV